MSAEPRPVDPLDPIADADAVIRRDAPALWESLSPLGRRLRQPANFLPLQSAEARGKPFNATIGQITDGRGKAVPLPSMEAAASGLDDARRSQGFLYSPVEGIAELRQLWRERQRRGVPADPDLPSSLPVVTVGPAQALALAAELFVVEGRTVVLPDGAAEADRDLFAVRLGARCVGAPCLSPGGFDSSAPARALSGHPESGPAVVVLRFPAEAHGYVPVSGERSAIRGSLVAAAQHRPVIAIVDDTWAADPGVSVFWKLIGAHPGLIPVKVDGADALGFPGGRVGFLTFPFEPDSPLARAVESKVKMLLRAAVGSPPALSQVLMIQELGGQGAGGC